VASINVAADEVLIEILPPERLVAVTTFADDPDTSNVAGRAPKEAVRFVKADLERLVAVRPDLVVVAEYTDADFLRLLQTTGLRTHRMSGLDSLEGIRQAILALGEAVGEPAAARAVADRFASRLAAVTARVSGAPRPRVLYWANPYTAGAGTTIGALIECGGGVNVGRDLGLRGIEPIGAERAFVADPDVVLLGGVKGGAESLADHPLLGGMRAVRERRVVDMPTRLLVALSQHAATSCEFLADALHPGRRPPAR
jgi:iron complex transport system substrate-binding protein